MLAQLEGAQGPECSALTFKVKPFILCCLSCIRPGVPTSLSLQIHSNSPCPETVLYTGASSLDLSDASHTYAASPSLDNPQCRQTLLMTLGMGVRRAKPPAAEKH